MDSSPDKKRMNVEDDRLSNLSDDIIHKILSFLDITQAIETSGLSTRWRYIWTLMPYLNFSTAEFPKLPAFSKFVEHVLTARNNQIEVFSCNLAYRGKVNQSFVKRILDYAFSHNIQQLNITCLYETEIQSPLSLFNSQSLIHLTLTGDKRFILTSSIWDLPALATLNLKSVALYDDNNDKCSGFFSKCVNLKNLTLKKCELKVLNGFNIRLPRLSSLTLEDGYEDVNVVTPHLKNLVINNWEKMVLISAPNLSSLHHKNGHPLELSADFLNLDKVDICIKYLSRDKEDALKIVSLFQQLHSVKCLTLNIDIIKSLSSFVEVISDLPSPFTKLTSLRIYPLNVSLEQAQPDFTMSTEVKNYLLDSSSDANFTMVSHEEIRAVRNVAIAQDLMKEFPVVLNGFKRNSSANLTYMEKEKALMESLPPMCEFDQVEVENQKMKWYFGERMENIKCYWKDLNKQMEMRHRNTLHIISRLQKIEQVISRLPTSYRDKLQARFSSLCDEADTVMDNIMDCMKMQCYMKPDVYFHELATSKS